MKKGSQTSKHLTLKSKSVLPYMEMHRHLVVFCNCHDEKGQTNNPVFFVFSFFFFSGSLSSLSASVLLTFSLVSFMKLFARAVLMPSKD